MLNSRVWMSKVLKLTEYAQLEADVDGFVLQGTVICSQQAQPARYDYRIEVNALWETRQAEVKMNLSDGAKDFIFTVDPARNWQVNGETVPQYQGCVDIDLGFSPITNTLPIRRLQLHSGEQAEVEAAWFRYPEMDFVRLPQRYSCQSETAYRYESHLSGFQALLTVDARGLVDTYEGLWETISKS